ncbi:PREDICTED: protein DETOXIFICATION 35-like [Prunus mume]|uniref:Protein DETOXIFICATION n=1 Tax=Prunus mume TaxID=102107 RepID=A0ABM0P496_PRUMU|nr:PREDICTED: protein DETOXIFICATION 35-like [Prunus mume]
MEEPLLDTASGADQLSTKPHDLYEGGNEDYAPLRSFDALRCMFWIETVKLWKMAGPAVITMLCMYGTNFAVVLFVGHLGTVELSAVSISLAVITTFAFGFLFGMGSALETLCGQAFGAGEIHMLGIYMQRSWIILLVTSLFILPIYIFATPVLKLLGQEDDIANLAGEFTIQTIPSLFSLAIIFPSQKFLQAQRKVMVLAWIAVLGLIIQIGLLCLFILVFGWGTMGAAVAFDIVRWGLAIAQVVYIMGWCRDGWTGFSWLAFKEIWAFVRLSLASAVMLCLEIWYTMSILILTGHLDNAVIAVGSLSICMNINEFELMLFIGINVAVSVRVSNELGSGRPRAAKYSVYVTVFQCLLIGIFFMIVILITKDSFSLLFTSDKELQQAVAKLAYLLGITMLLNSIQPIISGVAIGGGWQALVAYINLGCYYIFGLPLGYLLGYTANLGAMGVWGGMICGTALQTLLLMIVLYKTNWNEEVEQATKRVRKWGGQDVTAENGAQST